MGLLDGKNAVVTGSNRGIGRAIVEAFAGNGANVWACARKETADFVADMADVAGRHGVAVRRCSSTWPMRPPWRAPSLHAVRRAPDRRFGQQMRESSPRTPRS